MRPLPERLLSTLGVKGKFEVTPLIGNENDNYLVKAPGGAFVIKRLRSRQSTDNVEAEAIYRDCLVKTGLPVTSYLPLENGSCVSRVDGATYVALPYIEGAMARRTTNLVQGAAVALARTHHLETSGLPQRQSWYRKNYILDSLHFIDDKYVVAKRELAARYKSAPDFWNGELPIGFIHGDLHDENIIVNEREEIVSILDWEEAGIEPLVLDVAHTAQQFAFYHGAGCDEKLFAAFIDAYQTVRPLTNREKQLFDEALQYTVLALSVWAHIKASRGEMDEGLFKRVGSYYRDTYPTPAIK